MVGEVEKQQVEEWAQGLEELRIRIAPRFVRSEPRSRVMSYVKGLLGTLERKNSWQLAEAAGEASPDGMQRLLADTEWNVELVRDDLREYVLEYLEDEESVLIFDETGFLKKGTKSVGVQRQYSGTAGRIENCQIGVFLAYASSKGRAFIDRELYLPKEWAHDKERREEAGVPEHIEFMTKPQLARQMLRRAMDAGVVVRWVIADEVYGGDRRLRMWLEEREQPFVLGVKSNEPLWYSGTDGVKQYRASEIAESLPASGWHRLSAGEGSKGPRMYEWASASLFRLQEPGWDHWILVRRSLDNPTDLAYYVAFGPSDAVLEDLVKVAGTRWAIEESFETAKGDVGLDQYEVRKWDSWYRHITLSLLAHAYLTATKAGINAKGGAQYEGWCRLACRS